MGHPKFGWDSQEVVRAILALADRMEVTIPRVEFEPRAARPSRPGAHPYRSSPERPEFAATHNRFKNAVTVAITELILFFLSLLSHKRLVAR